MNVEPSAEEHSPRRQPDGPASAEDLAADLSLLLLYLSSWKEGPDGMLRSWKGFRFEILDEFAEQGLIYDSRRAKSAALTQAGIRRARELLGRYSPGTADPWAASTD